MKNLQLFFLILFFCNQVFGVSVDIATNADSYLAKNATTTNYSSNTTNWIYTDASGATDIRRTVIKFDLSSIPTNAVITSASLKLVQLGGSGSITVNVHRLLRNWTDAQVTWNEYSTGNSWSTAGGGAGTDYTSTATDTKAMSSYAGGTVDSYNVLTDVQNIVNYGGNNYGWIMKLATESGNTYVGYNSQDAGTPANRPILTVVYTVPTPGGLTPTAWFKADGRVSLSGSTITQWYNDATSATTHLTTAPTGNGSTSANAKPTFTSNGLNFNPAATFNGLQGIFNGSALGSDFISNTANSAFVVFTNAVATTSVMLKWESSGSNRFTTEMRSSGKFRVDFPKAARTSESSSLATTNSFIGSGIASSNITTLYLNGLQEDTAYFSESANNALSGDLLMGCNANGTYPYTGSITEVLFFNSALSSTNKNKVESYLALKYGATLGSTSSPVSYINSSETTVWTGSATYQNNIAGIARDDNSGLNQKQSTSNQGGGVVTMALSSAGAGNSIPSTNIDNTNTFSADNTSLVWGHNGNSLYGNRSDLPAGITQKSARTWKSELTGTGLAAQNVRVKFDLSSLTLLTVTDYTNYRLLLDADGTFASGATAIAPVTGSNGSKTVEFDVTMASYSGHFFTIGTTNTSSAPLPLQFVSFDVRQIENTTQLIWKTTSEVNCKNFEIEWSRDAINWEKIGSVDALNKASGINNYTFIDNQPHSGLSYYRIKQVDFDGVFTYSSTQSITAHKQIDVVIEPNPADDYLEIVNQESEEIVYTIFDINSKHIQTGHIAAQSKFKIDTETFPAGLYIIDFLLQDESFVQKFVVRH